jgi:large subunit ribosomal protein L9
MQVILMEKVGRLGNLGDIVKVKNGFARNYLIPTGKAKRATDANKAEFEARRADLEAAQQTALVQAQERAAKIDGLTVQLTRKASADGRLFGSVTNYDLIEALVAHGVDVEKSAVRMPGGPLKQVGDYQIAVELHSDVLAKVTVSVLGEG